MVADLARFCISKSSTKRRTNVLLITFMKVFRTLFIGLRRNMDVIPTSIQVWALESRPENIFLWKKGIAERYVLWAPFAKRDRKCYVIMS